jgi:hypothetical protein
MLIFEEFLFFVICKDGWPRDAEKSCCVSNRAGKGLQDLTRWMVELLVKLWRRRYVKQIFIWRYTHFGVVIVTLVIFLLL